VLTCADGCGGGGQHGLCPSGDVVVGSDVGLHHSHAVGGRSHKVMSIKSIRGVVIGLARRVRRVVD